MYAVIQNGWGLFGTGKTKEAACEDALEWSDGPLRFGENDGDMTIVPMLKWDEKSEKDFADVREIVEFEGFAYDEQAGRFYSINGDQGAWQDFCDDEGKSLCYLIQGE